jgi:membrane dipeptidase
MRTSIFLLLTALVAFQALWADGPTLLGTVRDRHTGKAVSSAAVQIVDRRGLQLGTAVSNSLGQWRFTIPLAGINEGEVPRTFSVDQNYPNPFNPSTKIPFSLNHEGTVRISVHNILGQLLDLREFSLKPGTYTVDWNAKGAAGVLFYSIEMDNIRLTKKMVQLDGGNRSGLGNILQMTRASFSRLSADALTDSCTVITSSLVYETDTTTVALIDSVRVDILLDSIHDRAFVIDLHNDVMEVMSGSNFSYQLSDRHIFTRNGDPQTDIPRYRDGGVDGQVFSIWIDPNAYASTAYFSTAMKFLDSLKAQAKRNSNDMGLVVRADSIDSNNRQKKISGVVVVEGGHCIEEKLDNLLAFYNAGVRVMTITWKNSTSWAVSDQDSRAGTVGLNDFGKQVIRTMDSLGMVIDVSHVGRKTITDILATSTKPIIASHSGAYALCNNARNLPDSLIRAIAARGGVMGIVFYPYYLTGSKSASLENVLQHIDYVKHLVGNVDCISLGSDFDGIEVSPTGLEDVTKFPAITEGLLQRGYTKQDVRKILGENFLRVFRAVCK